MSLNFDLSQMWYTWPIIHFQTKELRKFWRKSQWILQTYSSKTNLFPIQVVIVETERGRLWGPPKQEASELEQEYVTSWEALEDRRLDLLLLAMKVMSDLKVTKRRKRKEVIDGESIVTRRLKLVDTLSI